MAYARIFQKLLQNFFVTMGRAPITPMEWSKLRARAMELARKEGGDPITGLPSISSKTTIQDLMTGPHISQGGPKGDRIWDFSKDIPTIDVQSRTADIIPFPKGRRTSEGVMGLMKKGDVQLGKAPKTLQSTLDHKKAAHEGHINKEMWQKQKRQENKDAIERFKQKMDKNEPDKFYAGGLAPLVGEPSYAADFYDDRTPMRAGDVARRRKQNKKSDWFKSFFKKKEWPPSLRHRDLREAAKKKREEAEFEGIWRGAPPSMKDREKMYRKERTANLMEEERKEAFAKKIDEREKLYPYADMTEEEFSVAYPDVYDFMKKDPAFDFETFKKVSFANIGETFQAQGARDYQGDGLPLGRTNTEELELFMTPFGDTAQEMTTEGPKYGKRRIMSDIDKAAVVLHELRHKKILQDKELVAAQPPLAVEDIEWRHKGPERWGVPTADDRGEHEPQPPPHYKHLNPKGSKEKYSHPLSMHELFIRYLDDQYGHTDTPSGPYFDKIWRDEWKPYADQYEQILKSRKDPEEGLGITAAAQGGRIGMMIGGFTKAKVLIQMLENTLKGSKDPYVKKTFPNFIKEIQANPSLANNENVWKQFTTGLPKNQRLVVHSDDSVDFFTQSEFGPHNIEKTLEFQNKHNLSRDQANTILRMEPEDRVLEMKRLETIRNRTKQADGGPINQEALIQMYLEEGLSYDEAVQAAQATSGLDMDISKKAEGGIIRAGFPFGGQALKAIRAAWRANKDWGVGGPPYKPEKTSFNVKEMTKRTLGKELSLTDLRRLSESPLAGPQKGHFEDFNKQFKNIKAQVLREKMMERKLEAKAMIHASDKTMKEAIEEGGNLDMAKRITDQMKRESKKSLEEAKEGLKAIDIYMGMLQKKGRKLHAEGGRVSYSGGGRAGLPAITYGMSQPEMQGPQMPVSGTSTDRHTWG